MCRTRGALHRRVVQPPVASRGLLVAGQSRGHGEQLLDGDPGETRVGVLGKLSSQQLTDGLIQTLELSRDLLVSRSGTGLGS